MSDSSILTTFWYEVYTKPEMRALQTLGRRKSRVILNQTLLSRTSPDFSFTSSRDYEETCNLYLFASSKLLADGNKRRTKRYHESRVLDYDQLNPHTTRFVPQTVTRKLSVSNLLTR